MSDSSTFTALVAVGSDDTMVERLALVGFLAGYSDPTRESYRIDLRLFTVWFTDRQVRLLEVQRTHIELYGRWLETVVPSGGGWAIDFHAGRVSRGAFPFRFRRPLGTTRPPVSSTDRRGIRASDERRSRRRTDLCARRGVGRGDVHRRGPGWNRHHAGLRRLAVARWSV